MSTYVRSSIYKRVYKTFSYSNHAIFLGYISSVVKTMKYIKSIKQGSFVSFMNSYILYSWWTRNNPI